ncbi:virulence-associated protein E [Stutzerimonas nitrititolerans]|uniref:virulence-associated protein E n=1 Tax=Stutzerimonas nitrititolerans TaxID=2482751 RepID=UPI00289E6D7B|nr:virulence-associated protein E [Stutzerimonas nitrititolerans]
MPAPIDVVLLRLDGVKANGRGKWMARSPTRADKTASLSIRELGDGRVLLHDFGGDSTRDVLAAIGLTFADLRPDSGQRHVRRGPGRAAVEHERHIVAIGLSLLAQGAQLPPSDLERLNVARRRLAQLEGRA